MRDPDIETLHRRLFFDAAVREIGPPGVACDHRARSAPRAIAGLGRVDVARDGATGRLLARVWTPPDRDARPVATPEEARERLRALAVEAGGAPDRLIVEGRAFAWCR
ncbi:MAG: hypothetical protein LWW93_12695 [Hyphomicrobiales bacterium]|nr:hypothetical protein [Hyphomicrobiales bacterium]